MNQLNPTNQTLNFRRMGFLARRDLLRYWRGMLIVAAGNTGVMIVITILGIIFNRGSLVYDDSWGGVNYDGWFIGLMIIWGCIAASAAFGELHDKNRNQDFLLLPASALEKTLVRLLMVSLVLPLFIVVLMLADSLIAESIRALAQDGALITAFNPFGSNSFDLYGRRFGNLRIIGYTVVLQSVFFLGAAWFRKAHFIKTVLGVAGVSTALSLFTVLVFYIVFGPSLDMHFDSSSFVPGRFREFFRTLKVTAKILAFAVLPPFCWFTAWLRVKETQSSHGV